jgi:carbon monoxide dehydrogenase subunit G
MEIRETFRLDAPRDQVAAVLVDVPVVAECVPGVQDVTQQDDGSWSAVLAAQLGPIKARFAGSIAVDDSAAPEKLRAKGSGSDRGTGSQAQVSMEATLTEEAGGTTVDIVADVVIRGRLGQFGTGIIRATAQEMTKVFVECLGVRLAQQPVATPDAPQAAAAGGLAAAPAPTVAEPAPAPRPAAAPDVSIVRIVLRGLLAWARDALRRVGRRRSRSQD